VGPFRSLPARTPCMTAAHSTPRCAARRRGPERRASLPFLIATILCLVLVFTRLVAAGEEGGQPVEVLVELQLLVGALVRQRRRRHHAPARRSRRRRVGLAAALRLQLARSRRQISGLRLDREHDGFAGGLRALPTASNRGRCTSYTQNTYKFKPNNCLGHVARELSAATSHTN